MNFFARKNVPATLSTASIYDIINTGKIRLHNPIAVATVLHAWEHNRLWKWTISKRNKGVCGLPCGLERGVRYIDTLLLGGFIEPSDYTATSLYTSYEAKHWTVPEIIHSIEEYAKAAHSAEYLPVSPADKARMQKRSLGDFFYAGHLATSPSLLIHTPFLYFFQYGAQPIITTVKEKIPVNKYLFNGVCSHFTDTYGIPLAVCDKNKVVTFTDTLYAWYQKNHIHLPPNDQRVDVILEVWKAYLATWPAAPQSIAQTVGRAATETVVSALQRRATYTARVDPMIEQRSSRAIFNIRPTDILAEIAPDGNYIGALTAYCEANDVDFVPMDIDSSKLAAYSQKQVRQVLLQYRLGTLKPSAPKKRDWRNVLQQYEAK